MSAALINSFIRLSKFNSRLFLNNNFPVRTNPLKLFFLQSYSASNYAHNKSDLTKDNLDPYVCFKLLRLIKDAVKEKGPIPETNEKLATFLKRAEEWNIPFRFIDHIMRMSLDIRSKTGICELLYLNQGYFIVRYEDIDSSNTKHHLMKVCDKYDAFYVFGVTKWYQYFTTKGFISVRSHESLPITNQKEASKIASIIGAESVRKEIEVEDWLSWQFQCAPNKLREISKKLEENNYEIEEAYTGFAPKQKITLPGVVKQRTHELISEVNKIPAIDHLYHNIML